jgi:transcriptional regulator with XRE-family HTH domain
VVTDDPWRHQLEVMGEFIRSQRKLARLSLREMAERTRVSNPYLSQIERGLHEPSVRVLRSIAEALNISPEVMLAHAGLLDEDETRAETASVDTEAVLRADPRLTGDQKQALLAVYRSYVSANESAS